MCLINTESSVINPQADSQLPKSSKYHYLMIILCFYVNYRIVRLFIERILSQCQVVAFLVQRQFLPLFVSQPAFVAHNQQICSFTARSIIFHCNNQVFCTHKVKNMLPYRLQCLEVHLQRTFTFGHCTGVCPLDGDQEEQNGFKPTAHKELFCKRERF